MAYEGFRPEVLARELMTDRGRDCVFKNLTYKGPIIGEISKKGDVLHIAGVGRPTVRDYTPGSDITLEQKSSYNQDLYITQAKYVNVEVDRLDKAQAQGEIFGVEVREAKKALAQTSPASTPTRGAPSPTTASRRHRYCPRWLRRSRRCWRRTCRLRRSVSS